MDATDRINVLLVDDQPANLLSYELMLRELDENLIKAPSAQTALETMLETEIAVILIDVRAPALDGFELARMIRDQPRFRETPIIFVSAGSLTEADHLDGYRAGAVDYVPVPVVAEVLRAKVKVFAELFRMTKQLERLNRESENRVAERTAELENLTNLLAREVDHRARNTLAVVQSVVRLTKANDMAAYTDAIEGRIRALAHAQELLSQSRWQGADVVRLVTEEVAPYRVGDPPKVTVSGPSVILPPDKAQATALSLHELATNAAKYGALSQDEGRVSIAWRLAGGMLTLEWLETGGPFTNKPASEGFGSRIIHASIKGQCRGNVMFEWRPEGLRCTMTIPCGVEEVREVEARAIDYRPIRRRSVTTRQILLVEDDVLLSLLMRDLLTDMGYSVAGPYSSVKDALAAAKLEPLAGAVLDVNLSGEFVYPLAEFLNENDVPFVLVTGYAEDRTRMRFDGVPVLQKPLTRETLERALGSVLMRSPESLPLSA